jgi:Ca2+-binding RTX toxin-like protein
VIVGRRGEDTINAGKGNDRVCGGRNLDNLVGGNGDDRIKGGPGDDSLSGRAGDDVLDGGLGFSDSARFRLATKGVTASLLADTASGEGSDTLPGIEQLWGSDFDDTLTGDNGGGGNSLFGAGGNDVIDGEEGSDRVAGGRGDDTLDGGDGVDRLEHRILSGPGPIVVNFAAGTVTGMGTDTIVSFESVTDTPGDDIFEDDDTSRSFSLLAGGDDTVTASGGNDVVEGGLGDDDLDGGAGEDFLSFLNSAVGVDADLGAGTSTGNGTDSITGFGNIFGSPFADTIDGDGGHNVLIGLEGNDVISGFVGSDFLDGGDGIDDLDGGAGNDACLDGENLVNCE